MTTIELPHTTRVDTLVATASPRQPPPDRRATFARARRTRTTRSELTSSASAAEPPRASPPSVGRVRPRLASPYRRTLQPKDEILAGMASRIPRAIATRYRDICSASRLGYADVMAALGTDTDALRSRRQRGTRTRGAGSSTPPGERRQLGDVCAPHTVLAVVQANRHSATSSRCARGDDATFDSTSTDGRRRIVERIARQGSRTGGRRWEYQPGAKPRCGGSLGRRRSTRFVSSASDLRGRSKLQRSCGLLSRWSQPIDSVMLRRWLACQCGGVVRQEC